MRRWTNGLPGATARLGAKMALRGLSASQCRMRADTHPGPEQQCSTQRSDTLMQLSRSTAHRSPLRRTAGPYILAPFAHGVFGTPTPSMGNEVETRGPALVAEVSAA